jgi:hypothetical protein
VLHTIYRRNKAGNLLTKFSIFLLDDGKVRNLYSFPNVIRQTKLRKMRWVGHVARMGEERKVYRVLMGKPEGNRPLGRQRRRWEDGIKIDLRETG